MAITVGIVLQTIATAGSKVETILTQAKVVVASLKLTELEKVIDNEILGYNSPQDRNRAWRIIKGCPIEADVSVMLPESMLKKYANLFLTIPASQIERALQIIGEQSSDPDDKELEYVTENEVKKYLKQYCSPGVKMEIIEALGSPCEPYYKLNKYQLLEVIKRLREKLLFSFAEIKKTEERVGNGDHLGSAVVNIKTILNNKNTNSNHSSLISKSANDLKVCLESQAQSFENRPDFINLLQKIDEIAAGKRNESVTNKVIEGVAALLPQISLDKCGPIISAFASLVTSLLS